MNTPTNSIAPELLPIRRRGTKRRLPSFEGDDIVLPQLPEIDVRPWRDIQASANQTEIEEDDDNDDLPLGLYGLKKEADEVEEVPECCVCYEEAVVKTNCGHDLCLQCPKNLVKKHSCPYCRTQIISYTAMTEDIQLPRIYPPCRIRRNLEFWLTQ